MTYINGVDTRKLDFNGGERNRLRWYHFGLVGKINRAERAANEVRNSITCTEECRELAAKISNDLHLLKALMEERTIK